MKQVIDLKAYKGVPAALSNEYTRAWDDRKREKELQRGRGQYDFTRTHLNFEVGPGGIIRQVDQHKTIAMRMRENLLQRNIADPNDGLTAPRYRTIASFILGGSREQMKRLAFGDQEIREEKGADNSHIERRKEIEKWAIDAYNFMAAQFGEENIAAFIVHLDELNPHVHCAVIPIIENRINFKRVFHGETKMVSSELYVLPS